MRFVVTGLIVFLGVVGIAWNAISDSGSSVATQPDPGFLASLPKDDIAGMSGVTFTRPAEGADMTGFISRMQAEEVALKLWPGSTVLEAELAVVNDPGSPIGQAKTLWVVSLLPPGGKAMFPSLGPSGREQQGGKPQDSWFFYQTVDPKNGVGLWSHSSARN